MKGFSLLTCRPEERKGRTRSGKVLSQSGKKFLCIDLMRPSD